MTGNGEISFGRFRLDLRQRELSHDGRRIRLRRRPLDILCALASANGELVSKDELMERLWPGRAVEEGNLYVHMSALRAALDENGNGHSYVVTVPGHGYRLAGMGGFELVGLDGLTSQKSPSPQNPITGSDGVVADDPGSDATFRPERLPVLERRQLTVISCEFVGAAQLATRLDPEDLTAAVIAVYHRCSEIVIRFGGSVTQLAGGVMLGHFGYPQAGEYDAEQAVRAALAIIGGVGNSEAAGKTLQLRLGIATGPVVVWDLVEEGGFKADCLIGETVNLAVALQRTGEPSTVVIAESTRRLVGDLFDVRRRDLALEGFNEPVEAYTVLRASGVDSRFQALRGLRLAPLIGREEEIELLLRRWQRVKSAQLRVVLITGEPGIGKSRLCVELQERIRLERHACLQYFCSPHHQDSALYPVIRQFEVAGGFESGDTSDVRLSKLKALLARETSASEQHIELLADMLSLTDSKSPSSAELTPHRRRELIFEALVRQLEVLSLRRPVLIVFEDAQWSDPTTLEWLDLALRRFMQRPVLVVVTFRPEFAVPWTGQSEVMTLTLSRLDRRDSAALVRRVVGNDTLANGMVEAIAERTDGVPLFVEELSKALVESDTTLGAASVQWPGVIPTTLQASLMARLDRLPHGKHVAQIGAVIGRVFPHALLAEGCNGPEVQLGRGLRELVAAGLLNVRGIPPEATYSFKHALVQDAAYGTLLKAQRQQIHSKVATALEENFLDIVTTQPALLAHHCTEAGQTERALEYWLKAGRQALARSAMTEAEALLRRGLSLVADLPDGTRQEHELELLIALAAVLHAVQGPGVPAVFEAYARTRQLCGELNRPEALLPILSGLWLYHYVRNELDRAQQLAEEMHRRAELHNEFAMRFTACRASGTVWLCRGDFASARAEMERALSLFDPRRRASLAVAISSVDPLVGVLSSLAATLTCCGFLDQAQLRCEAAVAEARRLAHAHSLAVALLWACQVYWLPGLHIRARQCADELFAVSDEHGFPFLRAVGLAFRGWSMATSGQIGHGISLLTAGLPDLRAGAEGVADTWVLPMLADAHLAAGQPLVALEHLSEVERWAETTQARWSLAETFRLRGESLRVTGHSDTAENSFRASLALAERQGARLFGLRAATSLARLLRDQGKRTDAHGLLAPVYGWFTEGFETPVLKDARTLLNELQ